MIKKATPAAITTVLPNVTSFCKEGEKSTVDFADVMARFTETDVGTLER